MEDARVVVFEDDESWRQHIALFLGLSSHQIVAEATTLSGALEVVQQIADGTLGADVAILDGNLDPDSVDCSDARRVVEVMRANGLTTKIIGFSGMSLADRGIGVDVDLTKVNTSRIAPTIDSF